MIYKDDKLQCHLCDSHEITFFESFKNLGRASSDCKPWPKGGTLCICNDCGTVQKMVDTHWHDEVSTIYANYELYHQSTDYKEQPVFDSTTGESSPRSIAILNYVQSLLAIKNNINAIDIGCGIGNMLSSLSKTFTLAKLHGFEPNAHKKNELEQLKNIVDIYTEIDQFSHKKFDLLTMIHVLEHIASPMDVLKKLKRSIEPGGYLVIAVPDYTANPFDLIITDHASHFCVDTLYDLLLRSGLDVVNISNKAINKEIIAICKLPNNDVLISEKRSAPVNNYDLVQQQLCWMTEITTQAKAIAQANRPFGIFGTSIAANWIYGELAGEIDFFVDEDLDRVDKLYHEKPVYYSTSIPKNSHTLVCLQPNVVEKVIQRIQSCDYHVYPTPTF